MNKDTARCCSVLCPDGGSCSLQYSHTGEHYSTQELLLDMQNPDRHEVKRLRKDLAEALAACAETRAALLAIGTAWGDDSRSLRDAIERGITLLSRPDLGRGMVVKREVLERSGGRIKAALDDIYETWVNADEGGARTCDEATVGALKAVLVDLDALLKEGGG